MFWSVLYVAEKALGCRVTREFIFFIFYTCVTVVKRKIPGGAAPWTPVSPAEGFFSCGGLFPLRGAWVANRNCPAAGLVDLRRGSTPVEPIAKGAAGFEWECNSHAPHAKTLRNPCELRSDRGCRAPRVPLQPPAAGLVDLLWGSPPRQQISMGIAGFEWECNSQASPMVSFTRHMCRLPS